MESKMNKIKERINWKIGDQVSAQLYDQVRSKILSKIAKQVENVSIYNLVNKCVRRKIKTIMGKVRAPIIDHIRNLK